MVFACKPHMSEQLYVFRTYLSLSFLLPCSSRVHKSIEISLGYVVFFTKTLVKTHSQYIRQNVIKHTNFVTHFDNYSCKCWRDQNSTKVNSEKSYFLSSPTLFHCETLGIMYSFDFECKSILKQRI